MDTRPVAVVYLRHHGELFVRDQNTEGTVTVPVGRRGQTPSAMATRTIREQTKLRPADVTQVRQGSPIEVTDPSVLGLDDIVPDSDAIEAHPFLFECDQLPAAIDTSAGWVSPTKLLAHPQLWHGYDRIRPTVAEIASDTEHGSATLSVRALEVLRDEAATVAHEGGEFATVEDVAQRLVAARPTMTALSNRVCRALDATADETAEAVVVGAHDAISRALTADDRAASAVVDRIDGKRVGTLSRSGTVLTALCQGDPSAVLVAESRPGREGVAVADSLADTVPTTITSDAAFPEQLGGWGADVLLVGADAVLPDGRVVNKVGSFGAAVAGQYHGLTVVVATASDKIDCRTTFDPEQRTDGVKTSAPSVERQHPTFETVPPDCYDTLVTERGELWCDEIADLAGEMSRLRDRLDNPADG